MKKICVLLLSLIIIMSIIVYFFGTPLGLLFFEKPIYLIKPSPQSFVKDGLYIMNKYGVFSDENDMPSKEQEYLSRVQGAQSYDETLYVLNEAIKLAGGKHSRMITIDKKQSTERINEHLAVYPRSSLENNILTIYLPSAKNFANNQDELSKYIHTSLKDISNAKNIQGVIIDLRGNHGGDMRPMLGAISPFLHDGEIFSFVSKEKETSVILKSNQLIMNGKTIQKFKSSKKKEIPIAVITDNQTSSAAEVVLIALKGNENVKTFGQPTMGFATGVTQMPLYDRYYLALASAKIKDLNNNFYSENPIVPDVITDNPEKESLQWLLR